MEVNMEGSVDIEAGKRLIQEFLKTHKEIIKPELLNTLNQQVEKYLKMVEFYKTPSEIEEELRVPPSESLLDYITKLLKIESTFVHNNFQIYKIKILLLNASIYQKTLIVQADTGYGKSTQIPQYFFTCPWFHSYSVYVTEPRRVAAVNLANKVKKDTKGSIPVFSCLSLKDFRSITKGSLVYFTEACFLNLILNEIKKEIPLKNARVIILDEIHEYSVEVEIILRILLQYIKVKRPDLTVIVTSATLQTTELSAYLGCRVLECKGSTPSVEIHYLNQYTNYYYETLNTLERVIQSPDCKTVLVFFTGLSEMFPAKEHLKKKFPALLVYLFYGKMNSKDQEKVMSAGTNKVVLATNFAESSLTIPGVTHVIDCGREKSTIDQCLNLFDTRIDFISKASAAQRAGRAGRELAGHCFRMYTVEEYEKMQSFKTPKILCSNLELIILKFMKYNLDIKEISSFHSPSQEIMKANICSMYMNESIGISTDKNFFITNLGRFVSLLDFEPALGKMIYESGCCLEVITLACVLKSCDFLMSCKKGKDIDLYLLPYKIIELGDFVVSLFLARQYSLIGCDRCFQSLSKCKRCNQMRKQWAYRLRIQEKSLKAAFIRQEEVAFVLKAYKHPLKNWFTAEQTEQESKLALFNCNSSYGPERESCLNKVISNYLEISTFITQIVIKSLFRNLTKLITNQSGQLIYLRLENQEIAVPYCNSAIFAVKKHSTYLICYKFLKSTKLFMHYVCPVNIEDVHYHKREWLSFTNYSKSTEYETIIINNKGEAYISELYGQGSSKLYKIESDLEKSEIKSFLYIQRKNRSINLIVPKEKAKKAEEILRKSIEDIKNYIYDKLSLHISMPGTYCAVMGPGCVVGQIISLHDEIKYNITGLDKKTRNYEIINDLKNTFEFSFASIQRLPNGSCEATVYFHTKAQAEKAIKVLKVKPLQGVNGPIFEMVSLSNSITKGTKIRVFIPKKVDQIAIANAFKHCTDLYNHKINPVLTGTEVIASFANYASAEYFANNFRVLIRNNFGITASSATIMPDGIPLSKDLYVFSNQIKQHITYINQRENCKIFVNKKCTRVYCEFYKLPDTAKNSLMLLIKNDTLFVPYIVWKEILGMSHNEITCERRNGNFFVVTWEDWKSSANISCTYYPARELVSIYGLPSNRCKAISYLKSLTLSILKKVQTITLSLEGRFQSKDFKQFSQQKYDIEISIQEDSNTLSLTGLQANISNFMKENRLLSTNNIERCPVCYTNMILSDTIELYLCGHLLHKPCFIKTLENNLNYSNTIIPITCLLCSEKVQYEDLSKICEIDLLSKIENAAVNAYMHKEGRDSYKWCENSDCKHIYDVRTILGNGKVIRYCPECQGKYCTRCSKPAFGSHEIFCEKEWRQDHEPENEEWITRNTVKCPNCALPVEKNGGCNHMTCKYCGEHYCFLCGSLILEKSPVDHYNNNKNTICFRQYNIIQ